ncbi:uncharacterized protein Z519_06725 [Cladophialophora bantiana CBS 173.52]|uniref:Uncharacterized protein n=1 Tax=Cladophialophora bantiana (strain ATCC 10958 / CBS 173.52 / CDC B-1940 / NIH 8579) TaxID=1442370 RepID=A0A0D2ESM3_CLAB1|nr:uncharacterized protein Z519_06725 [Cladophialophora bantiana CBS 173.52]KIW92876.1 hypothetical protein Z519_06725 [Cladophialophora bantiana CBS 173.52]
METQVPFVNGESDSPSKSILTISLAKYLAGHDISEIIEEDWSSKATPEQQRRFNNQGFNLDPLHEEATLAALNDKLQEQAWDGVIVGWCTRGSKQFTVLFEKVVRLAAEEVVRREKNQLDGDRPLKLMFCEGPDDLVNTTLRTFGR